MKVLLINTNRMKPAIAPVGLDYVAASLVVEGHEVGLLDLCWAEDAGAEVREAFAHGPPDLAAFSFRNTDDCYFASGQSFINVLRDDVGLVREVYQGPLAVGGCGFSLMPIALLEKTGADYGISGDGEASLSVLLRALTGAVAVSDVPGLTFRQGDEWRQNPRASVDLSSLDISTRGLVDNGTYFRRGGQVGIETKRGCTGRCIYCADPVIKGARLRLREPSSVVTEIRNLLGQGVDCLHVCDSEFNISHKHAEAVCRAIIEAGLGDRIRWYAYATPSPFTEELGALMVRAGCVGIDFGVDSGSDAQLKKLGRNFGAAQVVETAAICKKLGITFMYDLLLGAPGETGETLRQTVELMKEVSPDRVGVSLGVRIYPGTPLATMLEQGHVDDEGVVGEKGGPDPAYYVSPALGMDPFGMVRELIGEDERFFLPSGPEEQDYNYNDNTVLQDAVAAGYRGAYWDILRKLQMGIAP